MASRQARIIQTVKMHDEKDAGIRVGESTWTTERGDERDTSTGVQTSTYSYVQVESVNNESRARNVRIARRLW